MKRPRTAIVTAAITVASVSACASDGAPDDVVTTVADVPFDPDVGDGIDTNVETSGNLEFDEPDEG